jgi:hypothetical protein
MGYTTDFNGHFKVEPKLDKETADLINGIASTRRMKRDLHVLATMLKKNYLECLQKYGFEGELYYDNGQETDPSIIDHNLPPSTQPSLWCQWVYKPEEGIIEWDHGEKFYEYVEWIKYLINRILQPKGYTLNGTVYWEGEDPSDKGEIIIMNNKVYSKNTY